VKVAARLVAILGAAALGLYLFRSSTRDVVLVYDLDGASGARSLEVVIRKGHQVVRRANFPSPGAQVRHQVQLTDGEYRVDYRLERRSGPLEGERDISITEPETIVLSLGP
jgi:hypothetical protein